MCDAWGNVLTYVFKWSLLSTANTGPSASTSSCMGSRRCAPASRWSSTHLCGTSPTTTSTCCRTVRSTFKVRVCLHQEGVDGWGWSFHLPLESYYSISWVCDTARLKTVHSDIVCEVAWSSGLWKQGGFCVGTLFFCTLLTLFLFGSVGVCYDFPSILCIILRLVL